MGGPCVRGRIPVPRPRAPPERRGSAPRRTTRPHRTHDGAHAHGRTCAHRDHLRDDGGRRTSSLEARCKGICSGEESRVPGRTGHRPSVAFVVRVRPTGVFDLLHPGHVYFLREARALGDELWVVVARDSTARKFKHEPIMPEAARFQMVEALKPVDPAVLGHEGNIYDILDEIRPDIIAIGYDQVHSDERIVAECRKRGLTTKVLRLPKVEGDRVGTRKVGWKVGGGLARPGRLYTVERG